MKTIRQHRPPHAHQLDGARDALAEAKADGFRVAALLDTPSIGLLLLNRQGQVVEANDCARSLLARGEGLAVRAGCLTAIPPADANGVARVIETACKKGFSGSIAIPRRQRTPLTLHATPVHLPKTGYAARVLLAEPLAAPPINAERVAAALGLTLTQGRAAAALAAGRTVAETAAATHRTEATVRWHIREALGRLGLSRQIDLVRAVLSTPGVFDEPHGEPGQ